MVILEESCMASADMQWQFYSGERIVAHGPLLLYNLDIFVWIQHSCLLNMVLTFDPSNSVIQRLWCISRFSNVAS